MLTVTRGKLGPNALRIIVHGRHRALTRNYQRQPLPPRSGVELFERADAPIWYSRNQTIYSEGDAAEYLYKIKSGCIRTLKVLDDGRRLIGAFYFPGDVFGVEPFEKHLLSAEAVTRCQLVTIKRKTAIAHTAEGTLIAGQLLALTNLELLRTQRHAFLLLKTAQERVVDFLLDVENSGYVNGTIDLPMKRQDIADYLGLTVETVSRMLRRLEAASAISRLATRRVKVSNRATLIGLNL
jgi:CRP/FNR family nitrogen fixation transcriptional regulator